MSGRSLLLCYMAWAASAVAAIRGDPSQPFPVTGLTTGINNLTGERPARQEINVLQETGGPAWDLYMLGLSTFQNQSESDWQSYFGIAAIHGRPFVPWNNVSCPEGDLCPPMTGYCPHVCMQFAAWHRPYLALYEQVLGDHIQTLASNYTGANASTYAAAAQTWRTPYWDWSKNAEFPAAATQRRVTVYGPEGLVNIPNPLYSYRWQRFPLNNASNYFPVNGPPDCWSYNETKRQPDRSGIDQFSLVNDKLSVQGLKDKVYRVFTSANDFETMASSSSNGASFEDPHNGVHNAIGAVMLDSTYSSFDPVFWLHHANVDRLVAMWQATHYNNTYPTKTGTTGNGLFATPANSPLTAASPLKPFYQADGEFHTAKTVASTRAFGYTYPEIDDWSMNADETRRSVITQVNELYGDDASKTSRFTSLAGAKQTWKEYHAQIQVERSELPLPCSINLMLGEHMAGQTSILSMPTSGRTYAEVPLTRALKQIHGRLDVATVIPSLQNSLRIEIRKSDGSLLPVESIPSLSVEIHDEDVVAPSRLDEFPKYSAPRKWAGVGRAAKTVG